MKYPAASFMGISPSFLGVLNGIGALVALAIVYRKNYNFLDWFFILSTLSFYYFQNPDDFEFIRAYGRPLSVLLFLVIIRHLVVNLWWSYGKH